MKTTILYIRRLLAIILLLFYSYIGWSQTSTNYTFTNTTNGSLTDISSIATELLPANTDGVNYGALSEVTDIGFTFYFMSTAYTQFTATEDGAIRFGNSVSGLEGPPLWTANEPRLVIFGSDNKVGSNGSVRYAVIGDAPNRVLVVEWNNMIISYPNNSNPEAGDTRWQIRLHEGSGVIEYVYGYMDYVHNQGALSGIGFTSANTNNKLMYKTTSLTDNSVGTSAGGYNILSSQVTTTGIISGLSSSADGSRRVYTFTPIAAPANPSGLSFTNVSKSTMTLNWTDNATNETNYTVYRSDDGGITYTLRSTLAANSTSFAETGLLSGTTYYWQVYAVNEGAGSSVLMGNMATNASGNIISTATGGLWSATSTWQGGVLPTSSDNVTIMDGATVTIDVTTAVCNSIQIGQGTNGILRFIGGTTSATLTTTGNVTVNPGGIFDCTTGASGGTRQLYVGNTTNSFGACLTNNGTFNMNCSGTNSKANVCFQGIGNSSISGSGTTFSFYSLTVNKGTNTNAILSIDNMITLATPTTTGQTLIINNGTLEIPIPLNITPYYGSQTICASTGVLWINNASASVSCVNAGTTGSGTGSATITGTLQIDAGTFSYGGGNTALTVNGTLQISGPNATLNQYGNVVFANSANFIMTDGNFNIDPQGGTNLAASTDVCTFGTTTFVNFIGGTMTFINPSANNNSFSYCDLKLPTNSQKKQFMGSTIRFGDGVSTKSGNSTTKGFVISLPNLAFNLGNVIINNPSGTNRNVTISNTISSDAYIGGDLTIAAGTLIIKGYNLRPMENLINNGTIDASTTSSTIIMCGTAPQIYSGTGGISTTNNLIFQINNSTGVTLNAPLSALTLNLTSGNLTTSSTNLMKVLGTATTNVTGGSSSSYVVGPLAITLPKSLASGSTYNFPIGKGTYQPFKLVNPTTNTGTTPVISAEIFDIDCGGTPGTGISKLNNNRYWATSILSGTGFVNTTVLLTESGLSSTALIGQSSTLAGTYNSIGGNSISSTITSNTITSLGYFAIGWSGPTIYTVTGGTGCSAAGVTVGLSGSQSGVNYQLQLNGSNTGSAVAGTGSALSFGAQTTAGTYTIVGTNTTTLCSSSMTGSAIVNQTPTVSAGSNQSICTGSSVTLTASGATTYSWSPGASTSNPYTVSPTTTTTYKVTGTTSACTATSQIVVTVNTLPTISAGSAQTICDYATATLTATGGTTYSWTTGQTTNPIYVTPSTTITYKVTGTNANGCSNTAQVVITVNPGPVSAGSDQTICKGVSASLTATGASTYSWTTGGTTATITVSPTTTTTYKVTGTKSGCTGTAQVIVNVNPVPVVSAGSAQTICNSMTATLTASGASTYSWSSGSTSNPTSVTPTTTTTYKVTGTTSGCTGTSQVVITVNATLTVSAGSAQTICNGTSATLTASGATTYSWSTTQTSNPITVTPSVTTSYQVTGTSGSCSATSQVVVTVSLSAGADQSICSGSSTTLTASGATTYSWSSGSTSNPITVSPTVTTTYKVTGTKTGCTATSQVIVTVNPIPTVSAGSAQTICNGSSTTLTAQGATTYSWTTGSTSNPITVSPTITTTYTVTGTSSGCSATSQVIVTVNAIPTVSAGSAQTICNGTSATLTASGATTYSWSTGTTTNPVTVSPTITTTYQVTGTTSGCTGTSQVFVTVNALPSVSAGSAQSICNGSTATLTASGGTTYSWSTGATTNPITVTPTSTTTYTVTGTTSGCIASSQVIVTVNAIPTVSAGSAQTICSGTSATLTASGASTYSWTTGATTNPVTVSPTITTTYKVTGTTSGCTGTSQVVVTVNALPSVSAGSSQTICSGSSTTLTAQGATTYSWTTGSTNNSITVSPTSTTTYIVTGNTSGCTATSQVTVTVNALPVVSGGASQTICTGTSATLTATGAATYSWTGAASNPITVTPTISTTYTVTGTTSGCTGTAQTVVTVFPGSFSASTNQTICSGSTATLSANGAISYSWTTSETTANISVTPTTTTTYKVTGTTSGCTATSQVIVTVNASPSVSAGTNQTICNSTSATLTASGATTYSWSTGTTTNPVTVSPTTTTTYKVTGTASSCSATSQVVVTVNAIPTVSAGSAQTICNGSSATLTASGATTYSWTTGAITNSITVSPASTTTYKVTGTTSGCSATSQVTITVIQMPTVYIITGGGYYCPGTSGLSVGLTNSQTGVNYQLQIGGINTGSPVAGTGSALDFGIYTAGTYTVIASTSIAGCTQNMNGNAIINLLEQTTWTGTIDSCWNKSGNWDHNTVPNDQVNVIIANTTKYPIITSDISCKNLTINAGGRMTIEAGKNVYVGGKLYIKPNTLTLPSGSLIDYGTIHVTDSIKAEQYLTVNRWWYISSPITNATTAVWDAANSNHGVFTFTESTFTYNRITNNTTSVVPGIGYVVKLKDSDMLVKFNGNLNKGSYSIPLTGKGPGYGWNLIGNPYPSAIDWNSKSGWTKKNVRCDIWYRTNSQYAIYNSHSNIGTNGGQNIIPAMQAFWVKDTLKTGTLSWNDSVRVHDSHTLCKSNNNTFSNILRLKTYSADSIKDETVIYFNSNANDGYDPYDSEKIFETGGTNPELYTMDSTIYYLAVNTFKQIGTTRKVPLGFKAPSKGKYYISASSFESFGNNVTITLKDNLLNISQNLKSNPIYSFSSDIVNNTTRFTIIFNVNNDYVTVNAGSDKTICNKNSITLTAKGNVTGTFKWSNGSRLDSITVSPTQTTTYYVTISSNTGSTASDDVIVYVNNANVFAGFDKIACKGESLTLTAIGTSNDFKWNTGATTKSITVTPVVLKIYVVTVTTNGCTASDAVIVRVVNLPYANIGPDITVCSNKQTLLSTLDYSGYKFNWSTGDTKATVKVKPTNTETYSVTVTNANGCSSSDNIVVNVMNCKNESESIQSIADVNILFNLYPNPANETTTLISSTSKGENVKLSLYNTLGAEVQSTTIVSSENGINYKIDLSKLPSGIYLINLNYKGRIISNRIVKE